MLLFTQCLVTIVTVHSVHSNVAKIHSRLPAAMEFWLVCLGIVMCEHGSLTVGYQKKVPAGRIKPAFFVSNFWFLSIVFYCNVL